ncbi:MAG: GNAT family N-acetyltransferase [Clostridia bacterium]|nr:GNAT family N-acetyltransferase [Clostridia bacterium]
MNLNTPRLTITDFTPDMAQAVHLGSLDADTRRFLPDEVFETEAVAAQVIADLIDCYGGSEGPFVHPMLLADGAYAGYVQLVPVEEGWEIGYHTVAGHTGKGYATEAVRAFLPEMMARLELRQVAGICDEANAASIRVLEKCGFQRIFEGEGLYQGSLRPIVKLLYTL